MLLKRDGIFKKSVYNESIIEKPQKRTYLYDEK